MAIIKGKCPNCGAIYRLNDSKIPDKGAYARCPKCQNRFFLRKKIESLKEGQRVQKENHIKICPKCGYQRQPEDDELTPQIECPNCGVIYEFAKIHKNQPEQIAKQWIVSSEEKSKVYEEENVSIKAQQKAKAELDTKNLTIGCIGCLGLVVVIILIVLISGLFTSNDKDYSDVHGAWAYMQQFVEKRLKSPKNADFPGGGHRHVTDLGGGRYRVDSYVDAQNSFGAVMRTHFEGVIKRVDGHWELEYLHFK